MSENKYASVLSGKFWHAFWTTMRPYLIYVSGAAGLTGMAFIKEPETFRVVLAFIPFLFSYGLGQALTDCFQVDTDSISSPYRPLVRGVVSRKQVLIVSSAGLATGIVIMSYLNPLILVFGILAVAGLLTYTILKRTWWGGPPWNSWIVALLPIMGRLVDKNYHPADIVSFKNPHAIAFFLTIAAIFFAYANFVVMGYFKDISADRKTGYKTFPVVFGWPANAVYSDITALLAAVLTGFSIYLIGLSSTFSIMGISVFFIAVAVNLWAQVKIHQTRDEKKTHGPITNVVRVFILYCTAIVLSLQVNWLIFMIVFYFLFELSLKLRPEKTQV